MSRKLHIQFLFRLLPLFVCTLALSACALGPDYSRPEFDTPDAWRAGTVDEGGVADGWWRMFDDPALDALVDEALEHNADLTAAIARVDQARAALGISRSDQYPHLGVSGGAGRSASTLRGRSAVTRANRIGEMYNLGGQLSFEIDLWGKYRRATEAARADLLATDAARETVRLAVISNTVLGYFDLLTYDQQLQVARRTFETRRDAEELRRVRFESGLTAELDYRQSQVETATAEASIYALESSVARAENALSVLTGRSPAQIVNGIVERGVPLEKLMLPAQVPAGLPSSLLERRPDVRQAEMQLAASTARIGVAKAAWLPSISLTGLLGWESIELHNLISEPAKTWSISGSVLQNIFDAGRISSNIDSAEAQARMYHASYMGAVQNAFREVQDALVVNRKIRQRVETLARQLTALRRSLTLAQQRYDSGYSSFLEVLDAERSLFQAEIDFAAAQRDQLAAVVSVCKAMGGGWTGNHIDAVENPEDTDDGSGDEADSSAAG